MIEGLQIDVSGAEVILLMKQRQEHHEKKMTYYSKMLEDIEKVNVKLQDEADEAQMSKVSNRGPAPSLRDNIRTHNDRACYFKFAVKHIVATETYRLGDSDMILLGIMPSSMRY